LGIRKMTKSDKVKLGVAGGILAVAIVLIVWFYGFSSPAPTPPEPLPENAPRPNTRTPGG